MLRMMFSQLRRQGARSLAVVLGVLLATTGFVVLSGSVSTQQTRVTGFVSANSRGAYDILVRPKGSTTALERQQGLVRGNYLSGQTGGITTDQWARVRELEGVDVAAPIAMLGYVPVTGYATRDATSAVNRSLEQQVVRVRNTWITDRGLSRVPDPGTVYVYVTKRPVVWPTFYNPPGPTLQETQIWYAYHGHRERVAPTMCGGDYPPAVVQPDGSFDYLCAATPQSGDPSPTDALSVANRSNILVARLNADGSFTEDPYQTWKPVTSRQLTVPVPWSMSLMLAAVDPASEGRLVGLGGAVTAGRALTEKDAPIRATEPDGLFARQYAVPSVVTGTPQLDEQLSSDIGTLSGRIPALDGPGEQPGDAAAALAKLPHTTVAANVRSDVGQVYRDSVLDPADLDPAMTEVYDRPLHLASPRTVAGAPVYTEDADGSLSATVLPQDRAHLFDYTNAMGASQVSPFALDRALRPMSRYLGSAGAQENDEDVAMTADTTQLIFVGQYDPAELKEFSGLSQVAMETFQSSQATGGDPASTRALGGRPLGANSDPGGYVAAPPQILTTMSSIPLIVGRVDPDSLAPISEIQVRVSGITGVNTASEDRLKAVAREIVASTGLQVDIVAGSSPTGVEVHLPAGSYGRPALDLTEPWSKKGVAVALVHAVDRKSLVLILLVLVVCVVFAGNAVAASVRARRRELAILSCLGWRGGRLAALVLGESALTAVVAGPAGAALAFPLGMLLGVPVTAHRAALAVPVALAVALAATVFPAVRATRAHPSTALRPSVAAVGRARRIRGLLGLSWLNVARTPLRTAAAVVALTFGITAMAVLVGIDTAFRATASGSMLADAVGVSVRRVDVLAAVLTLVLSIAAAADVIYLGVQERDNELASLRASGWTDRDIRVLVLWEGVWISVLAALLGTLLAAAGTVALIHTVPAPVWAALAAVSLVASAATGLACLVPAQLAARSPIATLLAQE